eukprot:2239695-Amphidinium_carterae.1
MIRVISLGHALGHNLGHGFGSWFGAAYDLPPCFQVGFVLKLTSVKGESGPASGAIVDHKRAIGRSCEGYGKSYAGHGFSGIH